MLNELAPWDTEVVSVKENCTAYQTVTIRPHIFWNDPLHLRLGGERQRERWQKVCRGADCILQRRFWSEKHEVKIPSLRADPLSNLCFFSISISHRCHLNHILLSPHPRRHLPSLYASSTFSTDSPFTQTSFQSLPQTPCTPCQYLSGQPFVCVQTALNKYHRERARFPREMGLKSALKEGADGDSFLMTCFGFYSNSPLLVPSLPLSSHSRPYNKFNNLSLMFGASWAACFLSQPWVNSVIEQSHWQSPIHTYTQRNYFSH